MRTRYTIAFFGLLLLWLAACSEDPQPIPTAENTPTPTPVPTEDNTPTPTSTPLPTLTPSATPVRPQISAQPQTIYEDQQLLVESILSPDDGWLAVYRATQSALSTADLLGVIPIDAGDSTDLIIDIDGEKATETLQIALHGGRTGADETLDPAADELLLIETVNVALQIFQPEITVNAQEVLDDGLVTVEEVHSDRPGWLAIHNKAGGEVGQLLGYAPIKTGLNQNIVVPIRWREATPGLVAVLYEDVGESAVFEYDTADALMTYAEEPITADFKVTLPMEIVVFDQPIVNGQFVVERVISDGPGWLVVYQDGENGSPGFIIGSAPLADGLNEDIVVEVDSSAVTDLLQLTIHDDTTPGDAFDFPANDPRRDYLDRALYFPLDTTIGSYMIVRDQPLTADNEITVSLVAAEVDVWLVVHADDEGVPGEIIGQTAVPAGFTRDVTVTIDDPSAATEQLHLMLHADLGEEATFNPEVDIPLLQRGVPITIPFLLTE